MASRTEKMEIHDNHAVDAEVQTHQSRFVFGVFWGVLFICSFLVSGPWAGFHGVFLGGVGLLVLLRPPAVALPRAWWVLAVVFMVMGATCFLPASWIDQPGWRKVFEEAGIVTGPQIVIQARQAVEAFGLFGITLFVGLWLVGHRPSSSQLRLWALAFAVGVAVYAVVARISQENNLPGGPGHFGFFPNRNHTATYLAMGSICGLGCVLQFMRDKSFALFSVALVATGICLWAVAAWSISRSGVVLVGVGSIVWLSMFGRRYLGRNGLWALGLIALTGIGLFFIADSNVKDRLSNTIEKAGGLVLVAGDSAADPPEGKVSYLDFRVPIAKDTFDLIWDFKWTGIGAGQFNHVFPQYRSRTAIVNDTDVIHPESDWLFLAAETGVPATLVLAVLVILAFWQSQVSIRRGTDRALRGGCLVAAMLVPIHGIFDVPGHRITLALSSVFLYALALRTTTSLPSASRWPSRLGGIFIIAVAAFLIRAQWWGGTKPALEVGRDAAATVANLLAQDEAQRKSAEAAGKPYTPSPTADPLEKALTVIDSALPAAPLERRLHQLKGHVALHFEDKNEITVREFRIERTLQPKRVNVPFEQGRAWADIDPEQAVNLWQEALGRARRLEEQFPGNEWSERRTLQRIQSEMGGKSQLEESWKNVLPMDESR